MRLVSGVALLFTISFFSGFLALPGVAFAANYIGGFEAADCNYLSGWACDTTSSGTQISVDVYNGGTNTRIAPPSPVQTSIARIDLNAAPTYYCGTSANNKYGYSIPTPSALKTGSPVTVKIKFSATGGDMNWGGGSGRSITCASGPLPPNYIGNVESLDCSTPYNTISGWACDSNNGNSPINVGIYKDGALYQTIQTNVWRPDTNGASICNGNANHGFSIPYPSGLRDGISHVISVRYASTTTSIPSSSCNNPPTCSQFISVNPRTLTCQGMQFTVNGQASSASIARSANYALRVTGAPASSSPVYIVCTNGPAGGGCPFTYQLPGSTRSDGTYDYSATMGATQALGTYTEHIEVVSSGGTPVSNNVAITVTQAATSCGDNSCNGAETGSSCPADCASITGISGPSSATHGTTVPITCSSNVGTQISGCVYPTGASCTYASGTGGDSTFNCVMPTSGQYADIYCNTGVNHVPCANSVSNQKRISLTAACANVCTLNTKQCSYDGSSDTVQTCQTQANGCTDWTTTSTCNGGWICDDTSGSGDFRCVSDCYLDDALDSINSRCNAKPPPNPGTGLPANAKEFVVKACYYNVDSTYNLCDEYPTTDAGNVPINNYINPCTQGAVLNSAGWDDEGYIYAKASGEPDSSYQQLYSRTGCTCNGGRSGSNCAGETLSLSTNVPFNPSGTNFRLQATNKCSYSGGSPNQIIWGKVRVTYQSQNGYIYDTSTGTCTAPQCQPTSGGCASTTTSCVSTGSCTDITGTCGSGLKCVICNSGFQWDSTTGQCRLPAACSVDTTPHSFSCAQGVNPATQNFRIRNSGGIAAPFTASVSSPLSVSPTSGSVVDYTDATLSADCSQPIGAYSRTTAVTCAGESFSVPTNIVIRDRWAGNVDEISCGNIHGWACDTANGGSSIEVDIYDGGSRVTTITANQVSEADVNIICQGGTAHRFYIDTATLPSLRNGATHDIRVKFRSTGADILNGNQALTCGCEYTPCSASTSCGATCTDTGGTKYCRSIGSTNDYRWWTVAAAAATCTGTSTCGTTSYCQGQQDGTCTKIDYSPYTNDRTWQYYTNSVLYTAGDPANCGSICNRCPPSGAPSFTYCMSGRCTDACPAASDNTIRAGCRDSAPGNSLVLDNYCGPQTGQSLTSKCYACNSGYRWYTDVSQCQRPATCVTPSQGPLLTCNEGGSASGSFTIQNTGERALSWTASLPADRPFSFSSSGTTLSTSGTTPGGQTSNVMVYVNSCPAGGSSAAVTFGSGCSGNTAILTILAVNSCTGSVSANPATFTDYGTPSQVSSMVSWSINNCPSSIVCVNGGPFTGVISGTTSDSMPATWIVCNSQGGQPNSYDFVLYKNSACSGTVISSTRVSRTCWPWSLSCSSSSQSVVSGNSATFTATASGTPMAPVQYSWDRGSYGSSGTFTKTITCASGTQVATSLSGRDSLNPSTTKTPSCPEVRCVPVFDCTQPVPSPQTVRRNQDTTMSTTGSGGTQPYAFAWSGGETPATGSGQSFTTRYTALGAKTVTLNCEDSTLPTKQTKTRTAAVTVENAAPSVTSLMPNGGTYCGGTVTISANGADEWGLSKIDLYFDGSLVKTCIVSGTSASCSYDKGLAGLANRNYEIKAIATDTESTASPQSTSTIAVNCAVLNAGISPASMETYVNTQKTFTGTASGGACNYALAWGASGGSPASGSNSYCPPASAPQFSTTYSTTGSKTITLRVTDNSGQTKDAPAASVTIYNALQTPSCSASPANPVVGNSATFTVANAGSIGGKPAVTFAWSGGGTGSTKTVACTTAGQLSQTVTATDALGTTATSPACSTTCVNAMTITKPADANRRRNEAASFSTSASGGTTPYSYSWSVSPAGCSPNTGTGGTFSTVCSSLNTYTVSVTGRDSSSPQLSDTKTATLTITNDAPVAALSPKSPTTYCNQQVTFTGTGTDSDPSPYGRVSSLVVRFGSTTLCSVNPNAASGQCPGTVNTATYGEGAYTASVDVTDADGVTRTDSVQISISCNPMAASINAPKSVPLRSNERHTFVASASGGNGAYTYTWSTPSSAGPACSSSSSSCEVWYSTVGSYSISLSVRDGIGRGPASDSASVTPGCSSTCSMTPSPQKQCSGSSVQTCGDYNNDGCFEFGGDVSCSPYTCNPNTLACNANSAPIISSVLPSLSCIRASTQFTVSSSGASDPNNEDIRMSCDSASVPLSGSCNTQKTNPSCTFTNPWNDNAAHTVNCWVTDNGNPVLSSGRVSTTVTSDTALPTIPDPTISPAAPRGTDDSVTVTSSASDSGCGMSSYKIFVDDMITPKCTGSSSCATPGQRYSIGSHTVKQEATDVAGNVKSMTTTFDVVQSVSITGVSINPNPADASTNAEVSCGSSVFGVNCIDASLAGTSCTSSFLRWDGSNAVFRCTVPPACPTTQTATCSVRSGTCKPGATPSMSGTLNVQCGACSYSAASACNADTRCEWIYQEGSSSTPNACSYPSNPAKGAPKKYFNSGTGVCTSKGTTTYNCQINKCGAICDAGVGCPARDGCGASVTTAPSAPNANEGKAYWTQSGSCVTDSTCSCSYGSWSYTTDDRSKTQCGAQCGRATQRQDCTASLSGDQCNYLGVCSNALTCTYSQQYCPQPGTVVGPSSTGTCWYGSRTCNYDSGCGLSQCTLTPDKRCDAARGCIIRQLSTSVINGPAAGWYKSDISVSATDTPGDLPISQCLYGLNGATPATQRTCSSSFTVSAGSSGACSGQGTNACAVAVNAKDTNGVPGPSDTRPFSIDYTAPTVTVSDPPALVCPTTDITITATTSDSLSGVQKTEIYVDGALRQTCTAASCSTTARFASGTHTYYARGYDNAGNSAQTPTKSASTDSSGPISSATSDASVPYSTDFVKITATGSDSSGVQKIDIFADGALKNTCTAQTMCIYSQQYTAGDHSFYAIATDNCGNTNRGDGTAFHVNSEPTVQPIQDVPSCAVGETITLRCPANDADNDITSVNVWAGLCNGACSSQNDASWMPGNTGIVYHQGTTMSGSGNTVYTQTLTINQPVGTKVAATCQATDNNGRRSQVWGDRYPLCTVGGCTTPPAFSDIVIAPNPSAAGTARVTFTSSRDLQSNPSVGMIPGAGGGATQQQPCTFVSKSVRDYVYTCNVLGSYQSGRADISITGTDINSCTGGGLAGSFIIDTEPPITAIKCNGATCGGTYTAPVTATFTCTDTPTNGGGCRETKYSVDGGAEQTGNSVILSSHGTHRVTYRSTDNLDNLEGLQAKDIDLNLIATQGRMDVTIQLDKTEPRLGEKVNAKIIAKIFDRNTGTLLAKCAIADNYNSNPIYKRCRITKLKIDEGTPREADLLPGYDDSSAGNYDSTSEAWKIELDTMRYRSTLTGCLSGQSLQNCGSGTFNVQAATVDISIQYPDVDAQTVAITPGGNPNFTRSMPVNFVAKAKVITAIAQDCTGTACTAFYDITLPGTVPTYKQIFWDGFAKGYKSVTEVPSTNLQCNTAYNLWIKVTDQGTGATNEKPFDIFVNCDPTLTVSPVEARTTLGARNLQPFTVVFWNPRLDALNNMKIEMTSTNPQVMAWINFAGYNDAVDPFSVPALQRAAFTVEMPVAARSGKYPIDFTVTNNNMPSEQYKNTGTIYIFAEGLPEFQAWQLIILIFAAPLIFWKMNFFEQGKIRRKK